jgi:hypothetical protein
MPQSKWQELAKFTPEEMTGKPLLPSAAKDHKRQVRLEPDHTPFNHDITEDPIPVQGDHDEPQLPLQQEGHGLGETICHPQSGRPPGSPLQAERAALPSGTTTRSGRASIPPELWSKSMQCLMTQMRPRTRHINQKYHHFCEWFKSGLIDILPIDTEE